MLESGKAYLNGQLVDFSEFRVAPDLIQKFISTPSNQTTSEPAEDTAGKSVEDAKDATGERSGTHAEQEAPKTYLNGEPVDFRPFFTDPDPTEEH